MMSQQDYIEYPIFLKYLIHLNRRKFRQLGFQVIGFAKILQIAALCLLDGRQGREASLHLWSPTCKACGSQETPTRGEHPPEDQFAHG